MWRNWNALCVTQEVYDFPTSQYWWFSENFQNNRVILNVETHPLFKRAPPSPYTVFTIFMCKYTIYNDYYL